MCNISIYFCNIAIQFYIIDIKHLQHTSETPETYVCNMLFQLKHLLAASQMEARRLVEVTRVLAGGVELAGTRSWVATHRGRVWAQHKRRCMQRAGGWHVEITGELTGGAELGGGALRARWARHGQRCVDGGSARYRLELFRSYFFVL
jgi:hypothetical protein